MERLLEQVNFRDPVRAAAQIASVTQATPAHTAPKLRHLLAASPDPDEVLHLFARITASDAGLTSLTAVFSYSRFLSEAILREPSWIEDSIGARDMDRTLS